MIAVLERLIEQNQRQPALIAAALVEAFQTVGLGVNPPVQPVQNAILNIEQVKENRKKPSKALQKAMDWIKQNDPDHRKQIREVAQLVGVSVGTAHTARKTLQENGNVVQY